MREARQRRAQAGTTVVEAALVIGVLLAMGLGVVEMGYMAFAQATVHKAAEVGARYAVTGLGEDDGSRLTGIEARSRGMAQTLDAGALEVHVRTWPGMATGEDAVEDDAGGPCEMVEVEVRYAYAPLTPIVGPLFPDPMVVVGRQRMINEPWKPCGS